MFPNFHIEESQIIYFALILLRVSSFLLSWPVFSVFNVPRPAKILLSLVLTVCLFPVVSAYENQESITTKSLSLDLISLAMKEVFVGLCLGFMTRLMFFAVGIGGNLVATSMGLSSAQMFNPTMGTHSVIIEEFFMTLATLLFLAINGHHYFLSGLALSFETLHVSATGASFAFFKDVGEVLQMVCIAGIKISAPVMVAIFFLNVALGIIGRVVPQINVLVTSLPVNIAAGFVLIFIMIPLLLTEVDGLLTQMTSELFKIIRDL